MKKIVSLFLVFCMLIAPVSVLSASESYGAEIMYAKGGADCIVSMSFDDGYYDTALFLNEQFGD